MYWRIFQIAFVIAYGLGIALCFWGSIGAGYYTQAMALGLSAGIFTWAVLNEKVSAYSAFSVIVWSLLFDVTWVYGMYLFGFSAMLLLLCLLCEIGLVGVACLMYEELKNKTGARA